MIWVNLGDDLVDDLGDAKSLTIQFQQVKTRQGKTLGDRLKLD